METLINCRNLCARYDAGTVLRDVTFSVQDGDYLFIVGENGSGKSTLIKVLLGLLKPASGKIEYAPGFGGGDIGYLPQQTAVQKDFPAGVLEVVLSGCRGMSFPPFHTRAEKERANQKLALLGMTAFAKRCYRELSGGQQQRVLLARALCASKRLLLLDEPAAGLDPLATEELYGLMAAINSEGMGVIMISHDIAAAAKYAKHVLHLDGAPLFFGTREAYVQSEFYGRLAGQRDHKEGECAGGGGCSNA